MTHLRTPGDSSLIAYGREKLGFVPNFLHPFSLAPEIYEGWEKLLAAVRADMAPLRYELVTLAAARALGSRYCVLAHASVVLRDGLLDDATLVASMTDPDTSGLPPAEVAVMAFAGALATDPYTASPDALEVLRGHGLSENDIFHVITAVAARQFFTTVLAATGTGPDDRYDALAPELRAALLT
ncbi:carboxymuconolactone decarboxylase family protein [Actinoplanes sp. G11-F43]|uniref:carboxymuconolactone decarboxylase family protein n=1 Tax=Actinoplanes sp. G11-F43 TaxID=3424130 RepID=UPI003D342DAD